MSLWKTIAKNELRIKTNRVRNHRRAFYIIISSLSLYWGLFLGPFLLDAIIPDIIKQFSNQFESLIVLIIEFSFTSFFLIQVMYPLFVLFRKSEIKRKDIILSSPIKPADIIFGEFLGQLPFYLLFILFIGPFGIAMVSQINPDINIFHFLIFYLCFFSLQMFGSFLGTIISNWIEKRILSRKRFKNSENQLIFLIAIIVILLFYSFHFIFNLIRNHPELKNFFLFYPSFWYSDIILFFIDHSFVETYYINISVSLILAIIIPLLFFYISYKKASFFFDLSVGVENETKRSKREKKIYLFIRKLTPKKYNRLVILHFKVFLRKKENVVKLIYIIGTISLLGVITFVTFESLIFSLNVEPFGFPIVLQVRFDKNVITLILSWMGGLIFGILMGMYDFFGSKELVNLYKKSPNGIPILLYSYIFMSTILSIFYSIILTIFFTFVFQIDFIVSLLFFIGFILNSIVILLQSMGTQCIRPRFEERRRNLVINNYLILIFQIVSFLLTIFIFIPTTPVGISPYLGLVLIILINLGFSGVIASFVFYSGIRRLNALE